MAAADTISISANKKHKPEELHVQSSSHSTILYDQQSASTPVSSILSPVEQDEVRGVFSLFDKNKDGTIDQNELLLASENVFGPASAQEDVEKLLDKYDTNGDGVLDITEFLEMMRTKLRGSPKTDRLQEVFTKLDRDGDGLLSVTDVFAFVTRVYSGEVSDDELTELIKDIDVDGDGKINFTEFVRVMRVSTGVRK